MCNRNADKADTRSIAQTTGETFPNVIRQIAES